MPSVLVTGTQPKLSMEQRLAMASQIISVPPAGRALAKPGSAASAGPPPAPSPQFEAQQRIALSRWSEATQELLDTCVARPSETRKEVMLEVAFTPIAAKQGDGEQLLMPEWILVPPHELKRLWQDTSPEKLQYCLGRARSRAAAVHVPAGETPPQDSRVRFNSVLVKL